MSDNVTAIDVDLLFQNINFGSLEHNDKRFGKISNEDVDSFLNDQKNENTRKITDRDVQIFRENLAMEEGEHRLPEDIEPAELDSFLAKFFLAVKKKDGTEYESCSLKAYQTSLERYLKDKRYSVNIMTEITFQRSRDTLKSKCKQLKSVDKGNKPQAAEEITDKDIESMYSTKTLGLSNPASLLHSMWMVCTLHFGMCTGKETKNLLWGDVELRTDDDGTEYLIYTMERQTKTRTGFDPRNMGAVKPRAYANITDLEKCPVAIYKAFREQRPTMTVDPDSPFFLAANHNAKPGSLWLKSNALGINKMYEMMKGMKEGTDIDNSKRITPYSMRKHMIQKMVDNGVAPNEIIQISGPGNAWKCVNGSMFIKLKCVQNYTLTCPYPIAVVAQVMLLGHRTFWFQMVMYFTATSPYILMFVLLIRGVTLEGAVDGIKYYLLPDWERLLDPQVWTDAGTQIFYSYSVSLGTLTALGSYNKFHHNVWKDVVCFALVNSMTSFLAGFVIFSVLGFMAFKHGVSIDKVAESGPGLAFIAYPEAISQLPISPLWSCLFFIMIILLGLDSQFVGVEGFVTAFVDMFPKFLRKGHRREIFVAAVCAVSFFIGLSMVTELFDYYCGGRMMLVVAFFECVVVSYIYGVDRFYDNLQMMFGFPVTRVIKICWMILTPIFTLAIFILGVISYSELTYDRKTFTYHYPHWAILIGWMMAASSVIFIPAVMIFRIMTTKGTVTERITKLTKPRLRHHQIRQNEDMSKIEIIGDEKSGDMPHVTSCLLEDPKLT